MITFDICHRNLPGSVAAGHETWIWCPHQRCIWHCFTFQRRWRTKAFSVLFAAWCGGAQALLLHEQWWGRRSAFKRQCWAPGRIRPQVSERRSSCQTTVACWENWNEELDAGIEPQKHSALSPFYLKTCRPRLFSPFTFFGLCPKFSIRFSDSSTLSVSQLQFCGQHQQEFVLFSYNWEINSSVVVRRYAHCNIPLSILCSLLAVQIAVHSQRKLYLFLFSNFLIQPL